MTFPCKNCLAKFDCEADESQYCERYKDFIHFDDTLREKACIQNNRICSTFLSCRSCLGKYVDNNQGVDDEC
jgi:hypothetical protein